MQPASGMPATTVLDRAAQPKTGDVEPVQYVIEHMEEDDATTMTVPPWVTLEYAHMLKLASPSSTVHFTSLSPISCQTLPSILDRSAGPSSASYKVTSDTILQMLASSNPPTPISAVCLLDPRAEKPLAPEDRHLFKYFLFGGILGDDPPRYRTGELKKMGFEGRHLGDIQMTTDTALGVTKLVVDDGIPLDQIPYVDHPTISFNAKESVEMPFRYIRSPSGEPSLPDGMRELLKADLDKSFDF